MKPGKELDALIAEKVMGWTRKPREQDFDMSINIGPEWPWVYDDEYGNVDWSPSTDIAHAWEVVEAGFVESVVKLSDGRYHAYPMGSDWDDEGDEVRRTGFRITVPCEYYEIPVESDHIADTAPHAICLAALKAKKSQNTID